MQNNFISHHFPYSIENCFYEEILGLPILQVDFARRNNYNFPLIDRPTAPGLASHVFFKQVNKFIVNGNEELQQLRIIATFFVCGL